MKTTLEPVCFFCDHTVDTTDPGYTRIPTLESVSTNAPKAYAHELCAAEATVQDEYDRQTEAWLELQVIGNMYENPELLK